MIGYQLNINFLKNAIFTKSILMNDEDDDIEHMVNALSDFNTRWMNLIVQGLIEKDLRKMKKDEE